MEGKKIGAFGASPNYGGAGRGGAVQIMGGGGTFKKKKTASVRQKHKTGVPFGKISLLA